MGKVQMTVDLSGDLTTVRVVGKLTADDLIFWVRDYYAGPVTSRVLWDLLHADLSEIEPSTTNEDIIGYVRLVNEAAAELREGGRTAFVVGDNAPARRLFRRVVTLAEKLESPFERRTFTRMDEALAWLGPREHRP